MIRRFFRRARWDDERRRELQSYLDLETDENIARGMPVDAARAAAYRKLGNPTLIREDVFRMNTVAIVDTIWQDLRYGLRTLRGSPIFTAAAIVSLTLGIGANTAIFQLLDAVRLRPLPVARAQDLVEVRVTNAPDGRTGQFVGSRPMQTYPLWERIRQTGALEAPFAWSATTFDLSHGGESRFVQGLWASGGLFAALEIAPVAGRLLTAADDTAACDSRAVVLSESFWRREYGGAPGAVGQTIRIDGEPFQIVGVSDAKFFGLEVGRRFDVAAPLCARAIVSPGSAPLTRRDFWWLSVMGRPRTAIDQATAQLTAAAPAIFAETVPERFTAGDTASYRAFTLSAFPAGTGVSSLRLDYEQPLWVLLAIAGFVLLIASGNLANLLLARANAREREMAVRLAMGASRGRLVHQLLVESMLLSLAGAILGVAVAMWLSRILVTRLSTEINPSFLDLSFDWRVLGFTIGLAILTAIVFGLAPAVRATRTPPGGVMKLGTRGLGSGVVRSRARRALTVGQIALSFVLVTSAVMFARTLGNLADLHPGFDDNGVLVTNIDLRRAGIPEDQLAEARMRLVDRVRALPAVEAASSTIIVPLSGAGWNQTAIVDGEQKEGHPNLNRVSASFFSLMRVPILAGRGFSAEDTVSAPLVAIVSQSFAEKYFGNPAPLGRSFQFDLGDRRETYRVIGVAGETKYSDLREPFGPIAYFPDTQETDPRPSIALLVRGRSDQGLRSALASAVAELHPGALVSFRDLSVLIDQSLVRERLMATLSGFFGIIAALLAAVGLYGVMSYLVARRRSEFGIRLALGARRGTVLWMVLRESGALVAVGVTLGLALALAAGRTAEALLFGLGSRDVATFALAAGVVIVSAVTASALPASRAAMVSPTTALRQD
jgi:predicted permease